MKEIIIVFFIYIATNFILSCSASTKYEPIQGVYRQYDNPNIQLVLSNHTFLLKEKVSHLALYVNNDSITYGNWKIDNNFLVLSTPKKLSTFFIDSNIIEKQKVSKDSLYFIINNPIEKYYENQGVKVRNLNYQIIIYSNLETFDREIMPKIFNTNHIVISKPEGMELYSYEVVINISCQMPVRNIATRHINIIPYPYKVKNVENNYFEINIPKLDYKYVSVRRLDNDYVKIIDSKNLLWDGKRYIKD